jgi:hypothetical protein
MAVGEQQSSYSRDSVFIYRPRYLVILTHVFPGFTPCVKVNCRVLPRIKSISLFSIYSELHCPLVYAVSSMKCAFITTC